MVVGDGGLGALGCAGDCCVGEFTCTGAVTGAAGEPADEGVGPATIAAYCETAKHANLSLAKANGKAHC